MVLIFFQLLQIALNIKTNIYMQLHASDSCNDI